MNDIEYDPDSIATREEIYAAVREIAMISDAYNFAEFKKEVEYSINCDLIIPPEKEWIVEDALQEYRSLVLDEDEENV